MTSVSAPSRRLCRLLAAGLAASAALAIVPVAHAASFTSYSFRQATGGLTVEAPLSEFVAVSSARVVVPSTWRRMKADAGQLRFRAGSGSCRYRVTFTTRGILGAPGDAATYAATARPSATAARLLDDGVRGSAAWRVVLTDFSGERTRVQALRAGVLTRRTDIVPTGRQAWSELRVNAISFPGDECHSGSYRVGLGPQLGDALASARVRLAFRRID